MMERDHLALELDKVLEMLAAETTCPDAAEAARALKPSPYLAEATVRLDETDAAYQLIAGFGSPSFGQLTNTTNALRRADAGAVLSPRELLQIAETLRVIRSLREWRNHCAGIETCLDDRFDTLTPNRYLEERITTTLTSEDTLADNASPALADIRRKMRAASQRVRDQLDKLVHSPAYQKLLQDPIVTIRGGRFVVPVKAEHRGEIPGLVHDTSSSGSTVFIEPMGAVEANNEIRVLEAKEKAEIERILAELSAAAGGFADQIIANYEILIDLNLIFAKARLAYSMRSVRPKLTDDGHILLRHARHPLIDSHKVVPIDVELGGGFDTLVITGPNTGGKTVSLKTVGLLTLMAMCGLMPPVDSGSSLSVFTHVLADIGDEQSIEQSLSTFSAHMTNIVRILKLTDRRSLVLLDELGAGTDPVEGAALAIAILEQLRTQGARIAATTHYAELKAYAIRTDGVENGSCEFDVATLRPTYRLLVGVPGRSNAFAISKRLGMSEELVQRAQDMVSAENRGLEDVVTNLEARRQELESALSQAHEDQRRAAEALAEAERRRSEAQAQQEHALEEAKEQAKRLVEKARNQADALIDELDDLRRQKNAADFSTRANEAKSRLRASLNRLENEIDPVTARRKEGYSLPRELKAGDPVLIIDIDKQATVISPADGSGTVEVQAGIVKTRVSLDNLKLLDENGRTLKPDKGKGRRGSPTGLPSRIERSASTDLDLRGQTAEEALLELDRFLDNAVLMNLEHVTVIHGKGTGALRSAVQQHLRTHPSVKSYRLGTYGEGEMGVTVVELK